MRLFATLIDNIARDARRA